MSQGAREILRRVVPRSARTFAQDPIAPLIGLCHHARYRLFGPAGIQMMPGWAARAHPQARHAFRIHASDPAYHRELQAFVAACTPGMRLIDVGASYGVFTLAALHHGGPSARVTAIEPSAAARRILRINVAAAGATDRATVMSAALAAPDAATLPLLTTGAGQAHMMVRGVAGRSDATAVAATTLDAVAERFAPTHVKIDVEGFEGDVLKGAMVTLRRDRPVVFLELHCAMLRALGEDPAECLAILRACGYSHIEIDGAPASDAAMLGSHIANLICRSA